MNYKFFKQTTFFSSAIAFFGSLSSVATAATLADIAFIIDTSGSMSGDIAEVRNRIIDFDSALVNNNIDARYGLTLFGSGENFEQNLVNFSTFNDPAGVFQTFSLSGGTERGSAATQVALDNSNFRTDSVKNLILITDEDDDSSVEQFDTVRAALGADETTLFNFIGVPGVGNTDERYDVLASENSGAAFNIIDFRNEPEPFFDAFINTKVQEIIDNTPVEPNPPTTSNPPTPSSPNNPTTTPNPSTPSSPNNPTTTPEPISVLGLLSVGLVGFYSCSKK